MSISRDTFAPAKNYKRIRYHQDRDLLDSELNEQQELINLERRKIADILFNVNGHLKVHHYGHLKVHHFKSGF